MSRAASKSRLAELHVMFTEALIEEVQDAKRDKCPLPAADKSVIAKFLKDNDITADADSTEFQALRDEFEDELEAKRKAKAQSILQRVSGDDSDPLLGIIN